MLSYFRFGKSEIFSYAYFRGNQKLLPAAQRTYIEEVIDQLEDAQGKKLEEMALVLDRGIKEIGLDPPVRDGQHMLLFLAYRDHLDQWLSMDFIKVLCFGKGGRFVYLDNRRGLMDGRPKYVIPIRQESIPRLTVSRKSEIVILDAIQALGERNKDVYQRILTGIAMYNESCRAYRYNSASAIFLIASAFEAFVQLPASLRAKSDAFGYVLKVLWGFSDEVEAWGVAFYKLRNDVVHGETIGRENLYASKDKHLPHFEIGKEVFEESLVALLEKRGLVERYEQYRERVIADIRNKVISNKEKIRELLKHKKSFTYRAFLKNRDLYKLFLASVESLTTLDYSANEDLGTVLGLIFSILEDWIPEQMDLLDQLKLRDPNHEQHYGLAQDRYRRLLQVISESKKVKLTPKGKWELREKLQEIQMEFNEIEPVWHRKDQFKFTPAEFGDRCLRAIWGTY